MVYRLETSMILFVVGVTLGLSSTTHVFSFSLHFILFIFTAVLSVGLLWAQFYNNTVLAGLVICTNV